MAKTNKSRRTIQGFMVAVGAYSRGGGGNLRIHGISLLTLGYTCEMHDNPPDFLLDILGLEEKSMKGILNG